MHPKLIQLCQSYGIAQQLECVVNRASYTCYNYGPRGARIRRNIVNNWWRSCTQAHGNVHLVENARLDISPMTQHKDLPYQFTSGLSNGILKHYLQTLNLVRSQLPFGAAQIGQGTRHSQAPQTNHHHFIYSSADQTELTLHFYALPTQSSEWMDKWQSKRLQWWTKFSRTPSSFIVATSEDASKLINIQYAFPWGMDTIESIHNYGNQPLAELQAAHSVSLEGMSQGGPVLPDLLEVHTTVEWAMATFLADAFQEADMTLKLPKRLVLKLHPHLTPFYVALVTEGGDPVDLAELSSHLAAEMRGMGMSVLDVTEGSPEGALDAKRYDETGVMWTVILSQKTLDGGGALLRNRDTTIKERISIADLCKRLMYHMKTS